MTPATYRELRKAVKVGCEFLKPVLAEIKSGGTTDVLQLTRQEVVATDDLPESLGPGEAESISVCLHRGEIKLLTNDKRARNFCRENGISCLDLPEILRALWVRRTATKQEVRQLLERIEKEQGMVVKNWEAIFEGRKPKRSRRRRR